jgi:hypothetical protein
MEISVLASGCNWCMGAPTLQSNITNGPICVGGWLMSPVCIDGHSHLKHWIFQMTSNEKLSTWKLQILRSYELEVMKLYSLQLFYLKPYCQWNSNLNHWNSKFKFVNDLKWRSSQNECCRSQKIVKLFSWQVFNLNPSRTSKMIYT